ncbi:hypothetical protein ElyMa_001450500 [Elysia marginata]|uniref:Uncharacterized protein n=1 Tax=Elysia marginata TaxID=1093978 RepID=A0AAV4J490_9GAST|nr:hypothetical protein ElyMa_001450500 [Elysia marginata]
MFTSTSTGTICGWFEPHGVNRLYENEDGYDNDNGGLPCLHLPAVNYLKTNSRPRVAEVRPNSAIHKFGVKPHFLRSLLVSKFSSMYGVKLTHRGRTTGPFHGNA